MHTSSIRGAHWSQLASLEEHMVNAQIPQATSARAAALHHVHSDVCESVVTASHAGGSSPESPVLCSFRSLPLTMSSHHPTVSATCPLQKGLQLGSPCSLSCSAFACNLHMTFPPKSSHGFDLIFCCCCLLIFHCLDVLQVAYPFIL